MSAPTFDMLNVAKGCRQFRRKIEVAVALPTLSE